MATTVCLTFDFDAMSIWLGTFRLASPTPLSRGEFGARVGIDRILELLGSRGVKATFFVPGHTALTFPDAVSRIVEAGHEIAAHNDLHETPVGLMRNEEIAVFERAEAAIRTITAKRPVGYRSPAWDLSPQTLELLVERGYLYDSSLMGDDFRPYRPQVTSAEDGEVRFGDPLPIWEFPVAWELDDYPYFHFSSRPLNQGLRPTEEVEALWLAEFDYCRNQVSDGVFTLTTHPEIIGRGPRIAMLGRLIDAMQSAPDVTFTTMADAASELQRRDHAPSAIRTASRGRP
ncbi:MAG TPA: polysaccharide deacetylase [Aestuariivirgaceae bacterium]|nr:polysaccharide deacetylase [Aestuariivirgaceae bacterium]